MCVAFRVLTLAGCLLYGGIVSAEDAPNFAQHIAPILYENCMTCHRPGGGGPFNFLDAEEVQRKHRLIADVTESKQMPPWKVTHSDYVFANERGLEAEEIKRIQEWSAANAPMGDLTQLPAAPQFPSSWDLGEPDAVIEMEEEYKVPADGPDIYRNFIMALPPNPPGKYLKAMQYRPRATGSAHHSLIYLDTTGEPRKRDEDSPGVGYSGMSAIFSGARIEGWAIGSQTYPWPVGVSLEVQPNTDLLIQEHFHPSGKEEIEKAQIALYYGDEAPTRHAIHLDVPFAFGVTTNIDIEPGDAEYTVEDSFEIKGDVILTALFPHAHMVCRGMESVAHFPDGTEKVLIRVADWQFDWQERYLFSEDIHLPAGTVLKNKYWYDNSEANPSNPYNPPQQITWGPDSTDEMACFTYMLVAESKEDKQALMAGYEEKTIADIEKADFGLIFSALREQGAQRMDQNDDGEVSWGELGAMVKRFSDRLMEPDKKAEAGTRNRSESTKDDFGVRGALRQKLASSAVNLILKEFWYYIAIALMVVLLFFYTLYRMLRWTYRMVRGLRREPLAA